MVDLKLMWIPVELVEQSSDGLNNTEIRLVRENDVNATLAT